MLVYTPRLRKSTRKDDRRKARRMELMAADPSCYYCGVALTGETATIDHVMPLSKGGTWADHNTVLACKACNNAKGDQVPEGTPVFVKPEKMKRPVKIKRRWTGRGVLAR
jgi:5-methylcytosine-specific restriction endonuclease McrA